MNKLLCASFLLVTALGTVQAKKGDYDLYGNYLGKNKGDYDAYGYYLGDSNNSNNSYGSYDPWGFPQPNKPTKELDTKPNYTFKDLAGAVPQSVREVVEFMKNAPKYKKMGARMPSGILLVGPPGTGKTSIARAIAGEAKANFFNESASGFVEMYVGVGAQRVRELFDDARQAAKTGSYKKSIIFIDEIDAVGSERSSGLNEEYRQTINELLNQMSGFAQDDSIFVIAATNREQDIDTALKRPGRFDRIIKIDLPDAKNRKAILQHYIKKIKSNKTIKVDELTNLTNGMSGAELENIVNEAAIRAVRENAKTTGMTHFEQALADRRDYL